MLRLRKYAIALDKNYKSKNKLYVTNAVTERQYIQPKTNLGGVKQAES